MSIDVITLDTVRVDVLKMTLEVRVALPLTVVVDVVLVLEVGVDYRTG